MLSFLLALLAAAPGAFCGAASTVPGTLLMDFYDPNVEVSNGRRLLRRDANTYDLVASNQLTYYQVNLLIGTPPQNVSFLIDTGSSDTWVMSSDNPYCANDEDRPYTPFGPYIRCTDNAIFIYEDSSSVNISRSEPFRIQYGDTSFAQGNWASDNLVVAGAEIKNAQFALALEANSSQAVFGIGLVGSESTATKINLKGEVFPTYPNIPVMMKEQGLINTNAYSIWLDNIQNSTGSVLFGGVDHAKYTGALQKVPMVVPYKVIKNPIDFSVMLHGAEVYNDAGESVRVLDCAQPVLLDSGTSYIHLPEVFLSPIMDSINARYSLDLGYYFASCDSTGGITFDLSGVKININVSDILFSISRFSDVHGCAVGMLPAADDTFIFGDTFLRSVYAVFDLDNYEVGLAQAVHDTTDSNVQVINGSIPSAVKAPSYSSTRIKTSYSTTTATILSNSPISADHIGGTPTFSAALATEETGNPFSVRSSRIFGADGAGGSTSRRHSSSENVGSLVTPVGSLFTLLMMLF